VFLNKVIFLLNFINNRKKIIYRLNRGASKLEDSREELLIGELRRIAKELDYVGKIGSLLSDHALAAKLIT